MFTKVSSTGGFLRTGNTTLLIGIEDGKTDDVLRLIKEHCSTRKVMVPSMVYGGYSMINTGSMVEVTVGSATVFVADIEHFEKM